MSERARFSFREIAFVDPTIPDLASLLAGLRPNVEAFVLDPSKNALGEIARELEARDLVDVVHVIAHGAPGEVSFASGPLMRATLNDHLAELSSIRRSLMGGDFLLWSCQTAQGEKGRAFIAAL